MQNQKLREDKTCLNCSDLVEKNYCPNCGQENIETHKSFHYLITHFIEDLVHYDGAFWKSIKALVCYPGRLTNEYLAGRRKKFVQPVKLYIFINFLAFFLPTLLPSSSDVPPIQIREKRTEKIATPTAKRKSGLTFTEYETVREIDSARAKNPNEMSEWAYKIERRILVAKQSIPPEEYAEKVMESIVHNLPKALFLYMPIFAFFLWVFHGKKRWYYYDHGIFTLHYFSFLMLTFSMLMVISSLTILLNESFGQSLTGLLFFLLAGWWFFWFFRGHRKVYKESKLISRLKSLALFVINIVFIVTFFLALAVYSAANIN